MIVVLENPVAEGQSQLMLLLIGSIFRGIEPVFHMKDYTGFPYLLQG